MHTCILVDMLTNYCSAFKTARIATVAIEEDTELPFLVFLIYRE